MAVTDESSLTPRERRALLVPAPGSIFDPMHRVFGYYDDGVVFDYGDFDAADMAVMLKRDGKARSLEQVVSLPIRGADWKIEPDTGDAGEAKFVNDTLGPMLGKVIDQMTTAMAYKKAFFVTDWEMQDGKIIYEKIELRPATACEAAFKAATGEPVGFRQRVVPVGGIWPKNTDPMAPGYVRINPNRAFIHTHNSYADQLRGQSDLDVAYWCYETKQKIMFLWFQFLEQQSLPKTVVYGDDIDQAAELAADVANLKASGVLGLPRPGEPGAKAFEVLESSGKGAAQFFDAVKYLEGLQVASVLAGFTELGTDAGAGRGGSYALSADQSEFFLTSRQAVCDEMADSIREGLIEPLVQYNYGPDASIPKMSIGPLSQRFQTRALALLQAIVAATKLNVPMEFVDELTMSVASFLGLDEKLIRDAVEKEAIDREKQKKAMEALQAAGGTVPGGMVAQGQQAVPPGSPAPGAKAPKMPAPPKSPTSTGQPAPPKSGVIPKVPPGPAVKLAHAVDLAAELVRRSQAGEDPATVLAELSA